jgi:hypothetical protein
MQMIEWLDRNIAAEAGTKPAAKPKVDSQHLLG